MYFLVTFNKITGSTATKNRDQHVCMYRGRPSWSCPWNRAIQLGQGEGPIGIVGPMSNHTAPSVQCHLRWFILTQVCVFWINFTLGSYQRVICFLMCRGAESHQAYLSSMLETEMFIQEVIHIVINNNFSLKCITKKFDTRNDLEAPWKWHWNTIFSSVQLCLFP